MRTLAVAVAVATIGILVHGLRALDQPLFDGASTAQAASPPAHHSWRYYRLGWRGAVAQRRELRHANKVLRAQLRALHRRKAHAYTATARYAIHLAAITYQQPEGDLLRVAECESPGLDPTLVNVEPIYNGEHATGLFQFIPSTWASTPYARLDIFDPVANALAAGWMWSHGRRGEWACQ